MVCLSLDSTGNFLMIHHSINFRNLNKKGESMIRKLSILFVLIAIVFIFVSPAQAIFCPNCGTQNADTSKFCIQCGTKLTNLEEGSIFDQANELLDQEKCDEAISLLEKRFGLNPNDMKAKVCLAKAYLSKCEILKERGDKQYKNLAFRPLTIGRSILHSPDGLYLCAHSFLINDRPERARKYIKKAILYNCQHRLSLNTISCLEIHG